MIFSWNRLTGKPMGAHLYVSLTLFILIEYLGAQVSIEQSIPFNDLNNWLFFIFYSICIEFDLKLDWNGRWHDSTSILIECLFIFCWILRISLRISFNRFNFSTIFLVKIVHCHLSCLNLFDSSTFRIIKWF